MDYRSQEPYLSLSGGEWDTIVGPLFTEPVSESVPQRWHRLDEGAGIGNQIYRVTGTVRLPSGVHPWTLVVKVFIMGHTEADPERIRPDGREYWKREWNVYASDWLQQYLQGRFRAARCLGSGQVNGTTAEVAWIALEGLRTFDQRPWPLPLFGEVAHHIGEFTGSVINPPAQIWLSRHWHNELIEGVAPAIEALPRLAHHPLVYRIYPRQVLHNLLLIWERRQDLLSAQHQLTRALAHNDLFPRNIFIRHTPNAIHSIAIDWAYCGVAPIGQELTSLIGSSKVFGECPRADWDALEQECLTGYLAGLRQAGWTGSADEVRLGYLASDMLQGLLAVPANVALARSNPPLDSPMPIAGFNCDVNEYVNRVATMNGSSHSQVEQSWALLGL